MDNHECGLKFTCPFSLDTANIRPHFSKIQKFLAVIPNFNTYWHKHLFVVRTCASSDCTNDKKDDPENRVQNIPSLVLRSLNQINDQVDGDANNELDYIPDFPVPCRRPIQASLIVVFFLSHNFKLLDLQNYHYQMTTKFILS